MNTEAPVFIEIKILVRIDPPDWMAPATAAMWAANMIRGQQRPMQVLESTGREVIPPSANQ